MKKTAFLLILLHSLNLLAQNKLTVAYTSDEKLIINKKPLDEIKIANVKIEGIELEFPYKAKDIRIDSANLSLIILSSSKIPEYNLLYCYSLPDKNVKWQIITQANQFELFDSLIYLGASDREFMIDSKTGKILWQQNSPQYHIGLNQKNILISMKGTSEVEILQAASGKVLWSKTTKKVHGINDFQFANDSTVLFALDGIYSINLSNGKDIFREMITSYGSAHGYLGGNLMLTNKASILSWFPNGFIFFGLYGESGLSSNILNLKESVYLADNKSLYSLNVSDLSKNWSSSVNGLKFGTSRLYDCESNISLLNLGVVRSAGIYRNYNQPFFALFDKSSGTLKSVIKLNINNEVIRQFHESKNEIFILSKSYIQKLDYKGNLLDSFYLDDKSERVYGELKWFFKLNEFKSKLYQIDSLGITKLDSVKYIAFTDKGFLLFKSRFKDFALIDYKSLGSVMFENDQIRLIEGIEINKGIIFKRVIDLVYVVKKSNDTILENIRFKSIFNKQNYIVGVVNKKIQVYKIQE